MSKKTIELGTHQVLFMDAQEQYVGLFGGIGNGKTFAGCLKCLDLGARYPDNLILIGRLTYPELRDSTKEVFIDVLRQTYSDAAWTHNKAENSITLANKSTFIFRHLDNLQSLLGANLGAFLIDQAEEVDQEAFETLQGRLRRPKIGEYKGLLVGNPNGHDWVYEKFGMQNGWNEYQHKRNWKHGTNYRMITAPTSANALHLPANYISQLQESYSEVWFNRYVLGSWDGFLDQVFNIAKISSYDKLPKILMVLTACDPAISEKDDACNTAFCTLGIGDDGYIYDLETIAGHWPFIEQISIADGIIKRQKVEHFGVEDVGYQRALAEALRISHPHIRVEDCKADKDKVRRAKSVSHIVNSGKFRTNNKELINEMIAFDPLAKGKAKKDRCFVAGTMVATSKGLKPIETINVGESVLTPFGKSEVLAISKSYVDETIERFGLKATSDHKVFTFSNGYVKLAATEGDFSRFTFGELLKWRYLALLNSTAGSLDCLGRSDTISLGRNAEVNSVFLDCMSRFGKSISGKRYRKALSFITRTITVTTTLLKTLSVYHASNTLRFIGNRLAKSSSSISIQFGPKPTIGTSQNRVEVGTEGILKSIGLIQRLITELANYAAKILYVITATPDFAVETASRSLGRELIRPRTSSDVFALFAATSSKFGSIPIQRPVLSPVKRSSATKTAVYNLRTKSGCYYANGILVSNCDALVHCLHMVQQFAPIPTAPEPVPLHMQCKTSQELFFRQVQEQERRELLSLDADKPFIFSEVDYNEDPTCY